MQRLLKVNSTRAALAQLAKWEIEPVTGNLDGEQTWYADQVRAKITNPDAEDDDDRCPPGTYVYWREMTTIQRGQVEEPPPEFRAFKGLRWVRAANGELLFLRADRLIEML